MPTAPPVRLPARAHPAPASASVSGWTLHSAGGCEGVTGSAHLLTCDDARVLVDAGLFQGPDEEAANRAPWPFEPRSIDAVVLTHGHLDHVGRLPRLWADGFRGPVFATAATLAVAEVVLRDAAGIQAEDRARARRRARRAGIAGDAARPPYAQNDLEAVLARGRAVPFHRRFTVCRGVHGTLGRAGHVLGAAWLALDGPGGRVLLSGDLGDADGPLHPPPEPPPPTDALLIETTYADARHRSWTETARAFGEVVGRTLGRGGNVLIPTFALERTQAVLNTLQVLEARREIPAARVVLDAPMGERMTALYRRYPQTLRSAIAHRLARGDDPFRPARLEVARGGSAARELRDARGVVIVAGAGMLTGGRMLQHLVFHLGDPRNALVFVGYQVEGTLGREIVDGARQVRVLGEPVAIAAEVASVHGFSAHADADALDGWWRASGARVVVPVHGETGAREALAGRVLAAGGAVRHARLGEPLTL
ncbi:MAG: MBL fold metallo-hydrolase [Trueperaceae bacterium]|nr:MBL fold metallo-hydrolase [Trueperaceae bacterium]